jgi:hypothetical protein
MQSHQMQAPMDDFSNRLFTAVDHDIQIASLFMGWKGDPNILFAESRQLPHLFAACELHPMLPEYTGGVAHGFLLLDQEEFFLISGKEAPAFSMPGGEGSGLNGFNKTPVEAHAVGTMIEQNAQRGTLFLNYPGGPCRVGPGCFNNLPAMLPKGYSLTVWAPGFGFTFIGM